MARVRLVLRHFFVVCLSVLITSLVFYGIISNLDNINNSAGAAASVISSVTTPLLAKSTYTSNTNSAYSSQNLVFKTEEGLSLKDYQPIASLDSKPIVLKNIKTNLSAIFNDMPSEEIHCLLMINEYGDVDKIFLGDNHLSGKQRAELEQLFLQLRFTPGYLHSKAVPTVMRIVVSI